MFLLVSRMWTLVFNVHIFECLIGHPLGINPKWRVTQNKQIATSKDTMKDCQLEGNFFCLRNKLVYPNKNNKMIKLDCSPSNMIYSTCCANKIYKITYPWQSSWIFINHITLHSKEFFVVMSQEMDFSWLREGNLLGTFLL